MINEGTATTQKNFVSSNPSVAKNEYKRSCIRVVSLNSVIDR